MIKMMVAATGLSVGLMMMPVAAGPAKAGVNIDINIGGKKRISCRRGARIAENAGYFRIRARDCSGGTYTYFGRRNGKSYIIYVDSKRGYVSDVRRIGYY